jgi:hypothetical protein
MTYKHYGSPAMLWLVLLIALITGCGEISPTVVVPPDTAALPSLGSGHGDDEYGPCPPNDWGWHLCKLATDSLIDLMHREVNKFAGTSLCQSAANSAREILTGPVYVHDHSFPPAQITYDATVGPPHAPEHLIIAEWLFDPAHVAEGNLRTTLYHESAHVLGYQHHHATSTEDFVDGCKAAEESTSNVDFFQEDRPYVRGGMDGHMAEEHPEPETCVVRIWYIVETGEIVGIQILFCY